MAKRYIFIAQDFYKGFNPIAKVFVLQYAYLFVDCCQKIINIIFHQQPVAFLNIAVLKNPTRHIDYPDIKPPIKIKQNTQTNIKAVQVKTNTVDTESVSEPQ